MLTYNPTSGAFLLYSDDAVAAKAAGLTLSTRARGPAGEKVWFTADYKKQPTNNPYPVMEFWDEADRAAKNQLQPLYDDYLASWAKESRCSFPHPDGMEYMPFQQAGIEYGVNRKNVLIGDEPGLGKTIQAIGIANAIDAQKVLILCPASIRKGWQREIIKWSTLTDVSTYPIFKSSEGVNPYSNYVIVSYNLARVEGLFDALMDLNWDMMVIDEAHYLKTIDAQRTRAVFGGGAVGSQFHEEWLSQRVEKIVGLTGTPLPNRPREAYTLARGMCWEAIDWASADAFEYRYNPSGRMDGGQVREEVGREPELHSRLRCNFMVRRLKKDVLKDLPDKRYEFTYIEPNGAIKEVLAKEALIDFDPQRYWNPDFEIDGAIATVRREMGEAMVPRMIEFIKYLLDIVEVPKLVVYAHHRSVMDELIIRLHNYGVETHRGGMTDRAKDEGKTQFIHGRSRIWLAQLDTVAGIDGMQEATDHAVVAEPAWNPGINEQAVDRLHRYGQHGNVLAQFLLVEGSFNERVLHSVLRKAKNIHGVLDKRIGS